MSKKAKDWLNFILSALSVGGTAYGAALASGAKPSSAQAIVPAVVAATGAAANHLREKPELNTP